MYKIIVNPYILYSIVWLLVLSLYSFHWTYLYPPLSIGLFIFLVSTSFLSLLWGLHKYHVKAFEAISFVPNIKHYIFCKKMIKIPTLFIIVEFVVFRTIPLLSYLLGNADSELYQEFGVPFIHVIVVNLFLVLGFFNFQCFVLATDKKLKISFLKLFIYIFLALATLMNRAVLMYMIVGAIILFCFVKKRVFKYIGSIGLTMFGILFLFGMLGNIRNGGDNESGKIYMNNLCEVTPDFEKSIVPTEFLWPYIYITSPLSNVQFTINRTRPDVTLDNTVSLLINECCPQLISKRLNVDHKEGKLIISNLNVGSVYMNAYACLGWFGLITMFAFMFFFVEINLALVPRNNVFFLTLLILINIIVMFNIFDNMFIFSGVVPAVLVVVTLSFIARKYKLFKV